jgi:hypothetical protein
MEQEGRETPAALCMPELVKLIYSKRPWRDYWFVCRAWYQLLSPIKVAWHVIVANDQEMIALVKKKLGSIYYEAIEQMTKRLGLPTRLLDDIALFVENIARLGCHSYGDALHEYLSQAVSYVSQRQINGAPLPLFLLNHHRRDLRVHKRPYGETMKMVRFDCERDATTTTGTTNRVSTDRQCACTGWKYTWLDTDCTHTWSVHQVCTKLGCSQQHQHGTILDSEKRRQKTVVDNIVDYYNNAFDYGGSTRGNHDVVVAGIAVSADFMLFNHRWAQAAGLRAYRTKWLLYNDAGTLMGCPTLVYEYVPISEDGVTTNTALPKKEEKKHVVLMNCHHVQYRDFIMHNEYKLCIMLHKYLLETYYDLVVDAMWLLAISPVVYNGRVGRMTSGYEVMVVTTDDGMLAMALAVIESDKKSSDYDTHTDATHQYFKMFADTKVDRSLDDFDLVPYLYTGKRHKEKEESSCSIS